MRVRRTVLGILIVLAVFMLFAAAGCEKGPPKPGEVRVVPVEKAEEEPKPEPVPVDLVTEPEPVEVTPPPPPPEPVGEPSIAIARAPETVQAGEKVTIVWRVESPTPKEIPHTAIHYDTTSSPGKFGLDTSPNPKDYSLVTKEFYDGAFGIPDTFTTTITVEETIYYRAHAVVDGDNYWTEERSITVAAPEPEEPAPAEEQPAEEEAAPTEHIIEILPSGFSPADVIIKEGDNVKFVNKDSSSHWPASDIHPTHTVYPESGGCIGSAFDACGGLAFDESYSFAFNQKGSWDYHDHLRPSLGGTITVE